MSVSVILGLQIGLFPKGRLLPPSFREIKKISIQYVVRCFVLKEHSLVF